MLLADPGLWRFLGAAGFRLARPIGLLFRGEAGRHAFSGNINTRGALELLSPDRGLDRRAPLPACRKDKEDHRAGNLNLGPGSGRRQA